MKVVTAFLFSLLIFVFTIHNFLKSITVNKVSICYKDYLTTLLHKFAYSLVKYSQNVA